MKIKDFSGLDPTRPGGLRRALDFQLNQFLDGALECVEDAVMETTEQLKLRTPKDTNTATYGWHISTDAVSAWVPALGKTYDIEYDLSGAMEVRRPKRTRTGYYIIQNNVPYIDALNESHPDAKGFVNTIMNEFDSVLAEKKRRAGFE